MRYEMVRRHQADGIPISDVAASFGVSRPTFYKTQDTLAAAGLAGLLPQPRGPKGGHKISAEVVAFAVDLKAASPEMTTRQCLAAGEACFGIKVHRRSLERALARKKTIRPAVSAVSANAVDTYELLRAAVLRADPDAGPNLDVLRREGLTAWSRSLIETHNIASPPPDPVRRLPACPGNTADEVSELTRLIAGIVLAITAEPARV